VCTKFCDPENEGAWVSNVTFTNNLTPYLRIVSLEKIFNKTKGKLGTTPANSELGRLIQLLNVAIPDFSPTDICQ
jgi:hypothetical protein